MRAMNVLCVVMMMMPPTPFQVVAQEVKMEAVKRHHEEGSEVG